MQSLLIKALNFATSLLSLSLQILVGCLLRLKRWYVLIFYMLHINCYIFHFNSALPKIIKTGFSAINLIYFFTAGPDEVIYPHTYFHSNDKGCLIFYKSAVGFVHQPRRIINF